MSSLRVQEAVARNTDPIESFEAGENPSAREASEREVLAILRFTSHMALTDGQIADRRTGDWTPQRLRTARKQLVDKGLVVKAGRREGASPTGRAAMTYRIAEVTR